MGKIIKSRIAVLFYLIGFIILLFYFFVLTQIDFSSIFNKLSIFIIILYTIFILIGNFLLLSVLSGIEKHKVKRFSLFCFFLLYIMILCKILFKNGTGWNYNSLYEYFVENSNFIPLKNISIYLLSFVNDTMNKSIIIENILGNILIFLPMGIYFAAFLKRNRFICFFSFLVLLESIQLLTKTGFFDIDDILLNLIGFTFGTYFTRLRSIQKMFGIDVQNKKEEVEKYEKD